jgi:hypothetical protein
VFSLSGIEFKLLQLNWSLTPILWGSETIGSKPGGWRWLTARDLIAIMGGDKATT